MIDLQPTLTGAAVILRPLRPDDWDALFAVASDPAIWALHPAHDRWREPVFRAFFAEALASGAALVALDPVAGAVIGSSRFDRGRAEPGEIEIGWTFLARSHWGGAINGAMKALMIGHALTGFDRVIFLIGEDNLRSRRAIEKIGAVLTDRIDEAEMAGRTVRHVVYAIDRAGFAGGAVGGGVRRKRQASAGVRRVRRNSLSDFFGFAASRAILQFRPAHSKQDHAKPQRRLWSAAAQSRKIVVVYSI